MTLRTDFGPVRRLLVRAFGNEGGTVASILEKLGVGSVGDTELDDTGVAAGAYTWANVTLTATGRATAASSNSEPVTSLNDLSGAVSLLAGDGVTIDSDPGEKTLTISAEGGGGGASWVPMVTGAEPPELLSDGAGNLILTSYSP